MAALQIRPAEKTDLDAIIEIQEASYHSIPPESSSSMLSKLHVKGGISSVVIFKGEVAGYLLAIPALLYHPPPYNEITRTIRQDCDCLYLHDLAVSPAVRGMGAGSILVTRFFDHLSLTPYHYAGLIAVQGSMEYWKRYGFSPDPLDRVAASKLAGYGSDAVYMVWKRDS